MEPEVLLPNSHGWPLVPAQSQMNRVHALHSFKTHAGRYIIRPFTP